MVAALRFQDHVDLGIERLLGALLPRFCCGSSPCVELCDFEASRLRENVSAILHGHRYDSSVMHTLITVPPTVNRPLYQSALFAQVGVQLRERPSDRIALAFVVQPITLVLILSAACAWVNAVGRLELLAQFINVHRFDVASYRVLHLHAVARVLESDPLNAIVVLSHHEGCRRGYRTGGCTAIRAV